MFKMTLILIIIFMLALLVEIADYDQHRLYWKRWGREKSFLDFVINGGDSE